MLIEVFLQFLVYAFAFIVLVYIDYADHDSPPRTDLGAATVTAPTGPIIGLAYCKFYREVVPRDKRHVVPTATPSITIAPPVETKGGENEHEIKQMIVLADKLFGTDKRKKAFDILDHALQVYPANADLLVQMGEAKLKRGDGDIRQADRYISRAIQLEPNHETALALRRHTRHLSIALDNKRLGEIDVKKMSLQERHLAEVKTNYKLMATLNEQYYHFIYHTLAIEGNTLTFKEVRDVIQTGKAPTGADVSELSEIVGMESAIKLVNRTIPSIVTEDHIQKLHQRILGPVDPDNAGVYRQGPVFVGSFTPPPAAKVPSLMAEFASFISSEEFRKIHPIRRAAYIHHQFTFIHPFVDGNGRTARLLMNHELMSAGYPYISIKVADRLSYYRVLDEASKGDILEFERFITETMATTLDLYLDCTMRAKNGQQIDDRSENPSKINENYYRDTIEL